MNVIAGPSATVVRLGGQFGPRQARSVEGLLSTFRPVRHMVIDFGDVREVDPAAVATLARTLDAFRESRVTFRGLSRHLRRVLRYLGLEVDGAPPPGALAAPGRAAGIHES